MRPYDFLTAEQQQSVVDAVRFAEKRTSGEIRIHIDSICKDDPVSSAVRIFNRLGMQKTQLRNGVLIYLACDSKVFAVIGDKGINEVVPGNFWESISAVMSDEFREGRFAEGLTKGIDMIGEKLKEYFPYQEDDINEQPDDISFGE